MVKRSLLTIARQVHSLVSREASPSRLDGLASLALALKPLLDGADFHPDLGLELLEFANLRRDGEQKAAEGFGKTVKQLINETELAHSAGS